ncbi:MAG: DUF2145 domain-containing protein [Rubrivivax sp.]|nr:DUF2145 domain-containing protein [Rubrivivax sp.]
MRRAAVRGAAVVAAAVAAVGAATLSAATAHAGTLRYCDATPPLSAGQQGRLLQLSAIVKSELERSGSRVALVSRSGLNLRWFGMRYSHAGLSLQGSGETPWAVRQLYFACDEAAPRLFDQGLSAFLLGTEDPALGYVSVVLLPADAAATLETVALDNRRALSLLGARYSANAHAWSLQYQNCNQWLIELLGLAWAAPAAAPGPERVNADADANADPDADPDPDAATALPATAPRTSAQAALRILGYEAATFSLGWRPLLWLTAFSPYLHRDDHPESDLARAQFRVSMPQAIEVFVRQRVPGAERLEFCHTAAHVVMRRGWEPLPDGCVPGEGDEVFALR